MKADAADFRVSHPQVRFDRNFERAQLIVKQKEADGSVTPRSRDLTTRATFASRNPAVATVGPQGDVQARVDRLRSCDHGNRLYPVYDIASPTTRAIWKALVQLHGEGIDAVGPTQIVEKLYDEAPDGHKKKKLQTTLVSEHLRKLVRAGRVERLPQGERRALYRAVELI